MKKLLITFAILSTCILGVFASSGDTAEPFQHCLTQCVEAACTDPHKHASTQSLVLRLTRWSCEDECKYRCMHRVTDVAYMGLKNDIFHANVEQYYGKWPFWRFLGMQEPASVLFSLLNMLAHMEGERHLMRRIPRNHPMRSYYSLYAVLGINTWAWSALFHTRDKSFTEKLDYFSASLSIIYSLYLVVVRIFRLYRPPKLYLQQPIIPTSSLIPPRHILLTLWGVLCALLYLAHTLYLSILPRFDYSYNITANVTIGVIHNLLWFAYSLSFVPLKRFDYQPKTYVPTYAWKPAAIAILITLASLLEVFDFPPWRRVIDAHSLWHLSTVPLVWFWYQFLAEDALDPGWTSGRLPSGKPLRD
ncbi:hypothetical protein FRB98_001081 [Tulasnella sp. 332]|nr:hypothetical protein FRB98_001081 [Tulasnella sp. 332]